MDGTVPLDESAAGTNFNPGGTPYDGFWDIVQDDTYPSIINGLIYAESSLDVALHPVVDGAVVSGDIANLTPSSVFDLTFATTYLDDPPPGFGSSGGGELSPVAGTWQWDTMP